MAGVLDSRSVTSEQELRARKLKRSLEHWREILLAIQAALLWERAWSPLMLIGAISSCFGIVIYFELPVLTTISIFGLMITLLDWAVPLITAALRNPDNWTGLEERKLEALCEGIIVGHDELVMYITALLALREARPTLYYSFISSLLLTGAWVGAMANNTLLAYVTCCTFVLLPGLRQHHVFERFFISGVTAFAKFVRNSPLPAGSEKVKKN